MAETRKIVVISSNRAEYGILFPLLKRLQNDQAIELQLILTGSHLSETHGNTQSEVIEDGFSVEAAVEISPSATSPLNNVETASLTTYGIGSMLNRLKPHLVVVLGDRFEILATAMSALLLKIPIAHLYGGEKTEGAFDDSIRHALTKLAALHFTSCAAYRKRVLQLGENPECVYNVGALGVENALNTPFLSREELSTNLNFSIGKRLILVTYHPETRSLYGDEGVQPMLAALEQLEAVSIIVTAPNFDHGGTETRRLLEDFCTNEPAERLFIPSLGRKRYLSCLKLASLVIGNSSSGIIESPSFRVPVVNIGDRQKGRIFAENILSCSNDRSAIETSIEKALSQKFLTSLKDMESPFGDGNSSKRIVEILKKADLNQLNLKGFHDIDFKETSP